jgi:hypothetical protein
MEVIGATIISKGKPTSGTITDVEGSFRIMASPEDTLVFSFVGFATQQIPVGGRTTIDVIILDLQTNRTPN